MITKAFEVHYLQPDQVRFERRGDTLSLTLLDELEVGSEERETPRHYPRVVLRSCFPVSEEKAYLSVRSASGEEQEELGILKDWTQLDDENRRAVAEELSLHYFVPVIRRVLKVKDELGFLYWTVETNKGSREFAMRNNVIRYAREVSPGHWLLIDVNQARYEIPDVEALDPRSQKLVSRYLYL